MNSALNIVRCVVVFLPLAAHAAVSKQDVHAFLKSEPTTYAPKGAADEVVDLLVANLGSRGFEAAAKKLAQQWKISDAAGAAVAEAELRFQLFNERIQASGNHAAFESQYLIAAKLQPDSRKIWDAFTSRLDSEGRCLDPGIAETFFSRAGAAKEFLTNPPAGCRQWLIKLPAEYAGSPLVLLGLHELLRFEDPLARAAVSEQLLRRIREGNHGPRDPVTISVLRMHWSDLVDAGLSAMLLGEASALDPAVLDEVLDPHVPAKAELEGVDVTYQDVDDLSLDWVLALAINGRHDEAVAKFGNPPPSNIRPPSGKHHDSDPGVFADRRSDRIEFIRNVLQPNVAEDPYDLFIGEGTAGLLWSAGNSNPLARRASAQFFSQQGYDDIAKDLMRDLCRDQARASKEAAGLQLLTPELRANREKLSSRRGSELAVEGLCPRAQLGSITATRSHLSYVQKTVPVELRLKRTAKEDGESSSAGEDGASSTPCRLDVPIVRCDTSGERWAAISVSGAVDPTGEVGLGGYWLHLSKDRGHSWAPAIYLGLQQWEPYVVTKISKLPLISGGKLQLEVQVRELDEASITFPPVGLAMKRKADDVYIERSLDELQQDSDRDGLTDILEDKLRLDPKNADTDGDGLEDASDPTPQVSITAAPVADSEVIVECVERVLGYAADAIHLGILPQDTKDLFAGILGKRTEENDVTFVIADKKIFAGLMLPAPLIVLEPSDLEYLNARYGIHYPVSIPTPWFNRARTKALVKWSAGWTGGTLVFKKEQGHWKSEQSEGWIT